MYINKKKDQILDVNLNRLSEGIKVIEDLIRFYYKKNNLLKKIRKLKQLLWCQFGVIRKQVIYARKSDSDLGRKKNFDINNRAKIVDILTVNCKRTQEASRVLEELFKSINAGHARIFKELRFKFYDLEKELYKQIKIEFDPHLYIILDIKTIGRKHLTKITQACIKGGATMLQLREPENTTTKQWLSDACQIQKAIKNTKTKFIINNRLDIALAFNADGIHLGKNDMPINQVRKLFGEDKIIGMTVRNTKQAQKAEKQGADYLGIGAIFPSSTRPNAPIIGTKVLQQIIKAVKIPVIAIGGINQKNIWAVFQTGTAGIAVIDSAFHGIDFSKPNFYKKIIDNLTKLQVKRFKTPSKQSNR